VKNTKLMGAAIGLALLGASGLALADGWKDRGGRDWDGRGKYDRGHDRGRHEGWYRGAPHGHRHHHQYHYYPRWHAPHRHYYPHRYHSGWGKHYGHDDGVTIIFKGRID
jgi:hypothetical protein